MVSTDQVKELREKTGISIMQCRKALEDTGGDMEKAEILLQKAGRSIAEKKADRDLGAGTIEAYVHNTGNVAAMVELSCETDFVSKNDEFKKLAYDLAMQIAATNPKYLKSEDITEEEKEKTSQAFEKELSDSEDYKAKPEEVKKKIMEGKVESYFAEQVLLNQPFIKDPNTKISQLIEAATQKFGEKVAVSRFARFSIS